MSKRIALIDDEEVFHWITKQFIDRVDESIEVLSFYNGNEALEYFQKGEDLPDVVMVDINMPIANGWVFLDQYPILPATESMPIYVVSSSIDPEDQNKAHGYDHVVDFVSKPLSMDFLQKVLA